MVHRETQLGIAPSSEMGISCVCSDNMRGVLVACSQDGYLVETPLTEGLVTAWDISSSDVCRDVSWFFCSSVIDTNSLLCVSHTGQIITVSHSAETGQWEPQHQVEGVVDSGILAAQWNPDQSCLALFAGDGSLIVMSPQLDVLYEVCVPPASEGSPRALSWSGDGDMCAVYSEDAADCTARIRVYSKSFELLAEGRGVAEGAAGVIKDLCPVVAFAPNASLVAGVQKKSSGKHQVTLEIVDFI